VRQDFRPGDPQTWAAVGIQGLAPYWFEVEATGYVGAGGRTAAKLEVEYELLFTNRLILQPLVELELYGKSDPERGIGRGLSSLETGLRLRYEIRREFAPYVG
jgi:copper resistance protein B